MNRNEVAVHARHINARNRPIQTPNLPHVEIDRGAGPAALAEPFGDSPLRTVPWRRVPSREASLFRQRIQKPDRISRHSFSKLRPIRAVPRHNFIEWLQRIKSRRVRIDAGGRNRPNAICKANQGNVLTRSPDFGVIGLQEFKRRQRNNAVTYRAGANQQPLQLRISNGSLSSILSGRRQTRSSQA